MSGTDEKNFWKVDFSNKAGKQVDKLPPDMRAAVYLLRHALEEFGPERIEWRNYSRIVGGKDVHHCHLNNNRPRTVVIWKVLDRKQRIIEVQYAGPHGSAHYSRFK